MTTTSSHPRLNNEVYVVLARDVDIEMLLKQLEAANMQCVIDLRPAQSQAEISLIELGAQSRRMHYAHLPELAGSEREVRGQPSRALAWAARTALRYQTCLLTRGYSSEQEGAEEIADLVGLQLIKLSEKRDPPGGSGKPGRTQPSS
jgi:hypothetical protein